MGNQNKLDFEGIERLPLREFAERAYLDYSMYVILDRALPHIADGLKPVQRRIVYAMSELGLAAGSKHKKSARTVGDVIGKFHPHGDSACYEAMVHMAQDFSYRYPIIDGQGNWGSADDPKSFAAMRYTEARLHPLCRACCSPSWSRAPWTGCRISTAPWRAGAAAGTAAEPAAERRHRHRRGHGHRHATAQPARGGRRPAFSSSTTRTSRCASSPASSRDRISPPAARSSPAATRSSTLYARGTGTLRVRATYSVEDEGNIVIDSLPYQASGARMLEQIASQMRAKKLPWSRTCATSPTTRKSPRAWLISRVPPRGHRGADAAPVRHHRPRAHATASTSMSSAPTASRRCATCARCWPTGWGSGWRR
jgi:topoisomerase-4 subunit A